MRTLAWSEGGHASSVSREDKILADGNILSILGGKLTTYRSMARKALRKSLKILGKPSVGKINTRLPGTPAKPWDRFLEEAVSTWPSKYSVSKNQAVHLAHLYGEKAVQVMELSVKNSTLRKPLHPKRPELSAQVVYAVQKEKAVHLDDVMLRRLEIGYSLERWGPASEKASKLMAKVLKWSESTRRQELERYRRQLIPLPPK